MPNIKTGQWERLLTMNCYMLNDGPMQKKGEQKEFLIEDGLWTVHADTYIRHSLVLGEKFELPVASN